MLQQSLNDFVTSWNRNHLNVKFALVTMPVIERPVSVEVRFAADRYVKFISEEEYEKLKVKVAVTSKGTMFVATDYFLFARGIIEIKIASISDAYSINIVANTLKWVGDRFFPKTS